jgi:hypothetical protein
VPWRPPKLKCVLCMDGCNEKPPGKRTCPAVRESAGTIGGRGKVGPCRWLLHNRYVGWFWVQEYLRQSAITGERDHASVFARLSFASLRCPPTRTHTQTLVRNFRALLGIVRHAWHFAAVAAPDHRAESG